MWDNVALMKNTSFILAKSIALLTSLAALQPAHATNAILSDDTTINRAIPRASYRTQPTLGVVATAQGVGRMAYVKFDLSNLALGPGVTVRKATLRVYCSSVKRPGSIQIVPVLSPWTENEISGVNAPDIGPATQPGTPVTLATKRHWITFDVTDIVRGWIDESTANYGIALVPQFTFGVGGIVASFDSKENAASSHEPMLDVALDNGHDAGPQGEPGPKGESGSSGPQGLTGPKGDVGPQGPIGATGTQGAKGDTGPAGPQGIPGPIGATGQQGPIGLTGAKGDTGTQGIVGSVGPAGAKGDIGPKGETGATGPQGPNGPKGEVGAVGPQGVAGPVGPKGDTGADGPLHRKADRRGASPCTR